MFQYFFKNKEKHLKNRNFEKRKKIAGVYHNYILHYQKLQSHVMMCSFWDRKWNRQFFCHFSSFFALPPLYSQKSKFWKNGKNTWLGFTQTSDVNIHVNLVGKFLAFKNRWGKHWNSWDIALTTHSVSSDWSILALIIII